MTDPRRLTDAALAEPITLDMVRAAFALLLAEDPNLSLDDALEAAWIARGIEVETLAERLAEAERDAKATADVVDQLVEGTDHWKAKVAAYEGQYCELYDVVDALGLDHDSTDSVPETITALRADLATEKTARVAAEGQAAELRTALKIFGQHDADCDISLCAAVRREYGGSRCGWRACECQCGCGLAALLAPAATKEGG